MMPLEEVVRLIDPALAVKRQLNPSLLKVYEVEKGGNRYILKVAEEGLWKIPHLSAERKILRIAHDVQGITHLVHDYGDINGYSAILKEYFEGKDLLELGIARKRFMQSAGNILKEALGMLHSLGFAELDVKPDNIVLSPDGRDARIIDLGMYMTASELGQERFKQSVEAEDLYLQRILAHVNGE